jgi:hypothetical protein
MVIKIQRSLFPQSILVDQRRLFDECLRRRFGERRQNGLENAGIALHGRIRQLLNLTECPQQDSQTLALPAEVDVRLTWRVCLLEVGYLTWRQGAPKTLGSQPGDDFISLVVQLTARAGNAVLQPGAGRISSSTPSSASFTSIRALLPHIGRLPTERRLRPPAALPGQARSFATDGFRAAQI